MIPQIPGDVIRIILENYLTHTKKSLYKLLFVNRLWCRIAIPLLWKNPWSNLNSWSSISKTILLCCDSNLKQLLLSCCDSNLKKILYEKGMITTPLFNYVSYIQTLSKGIIESLVNGILTEYDDLNDKENKNNRINQKDIYKLLQVTFWNIIMSECNKLKYLNLPDYSICHFNGTKTCLPSLVKLNCSTFIPSNYFFELSKICHNLQDIIIYCFQDNRGLAQLIKSQKRLKRIELNSNNNDILCPLIGEALLNQSNTITYINFKNELCISPEFLNSLINCKELVINIQSESNFDLGKLDLIKLPNLNTLSFYIYQHAPFSTALNSLSNVILSSSFPPKNYSHLKELNLDLYPKYLTTESIKNYLNTITKTCPLLESVVVWVSKDVLLDLESFLNKCRYLQEIRFVSIESVENDNKVDIKNILDILVSNNILPDLSKIIFKENWKFTKDNLSEFLESWRINKNHPLNYLNIVTSDELVIEVCKKFKQIGVLKSYVFD
ncbi:hypothetical protein C1645_769114 [Glomus cerebriforme]|uniref:F-box domain-containing protein n=1 Tax=Glomus cerebriforme TaxID=658196 RepID=A0A397T6Y5_9GLOM|nr:hypothetical protein C1645_769114 [Glomus cerebriforme]